jgi:hypothetical protein
MILSKFLTELQENESYSIRTNGVLQDHSETVHYLEDNYGDMALENDDFIRESYKPFIEDCFFSDVFQSTLSDNLSQAIQPTIVTTASTETGDTFGLFLPEIFQNLTHLSKIHEATRTQKPLQLTFSEQSQTEFILTADTQDEQVEVPVEVVKNPEEDLRFNTNYSDDYPFDTLFTGRPSIDNFIQSSVERLEFDESEGKYVLQLENIDETWQFDDYVVWEKEHRDIVKLVEEFGFGGVEELDTVYVKPRTQIELRHSICSENPAPPYLEHIVNNTTSQKVSHNGNYVLLLENPYDSTSERSSSSTSLTSRIMETVF